MFISATEFNKIPHVSLTHDVFYETREIRQRMDELIAKYGLADDFKPCSLHRHFPIEEGQLLLIDKIALENGDDIELVRPVNITDVNTVHPISYYVTKEGAVQPYKYARGVGPSIDDAFFAELSQLLLETGEYTRISIKRPTGTDITEVEIPEYNATVLFPMKYVDVDDNIEYAETAKSETHSKTVRGTHRLFLMKDPPSLISDTIFSALKVSV